MEFLCPRVPSGIIRFCNFRVKMITICVFLNILTEQQSQGKEFTEKHSVNVKELNRSKTRRGHMKKGVKLLSYDLKGSRAFSYSCCSWTQIKGLSWFCFLSFLIALLSFLIERLPALSATEANTNKHQSAQSTPLLENWLGPRTQDKMEAFHLFYKCAGFP